MATSTATWSCARWDGACATACAPRILSAATVARSSSSFSPRPPLPRALAAAEKLRKRIESHTAGLAEDGHLKATISIGVATTADLDPSELADPEHAGKRLMALADSALYEAKAAGRNRVSHDFSLHGRHLDRIPAPNAAAGESLA